MSDDDLGRYSAPVQGFGRMLAQRVVERIAAIDASHAPARSLQKDHQLLAHEIVVFDHDDIQRKIGGRWNREDHHE